MTAALPHPWWFVQTAKLESLIHREMKLLMHTSVWPNLRCVAFVSIVRALRSMADTTLSVVPSTADLGMPSFLVTNHNTTTYAEQRWSYRTTYAGNYRLRLLAASDDIKWLWLSSVPYVLRNDTLVGNITSDTVVFAYRHDDDSFEL